MKVYGLKSCDTCRKAVRWLGDNGIEHEYVDVRADGIPADRLRSWVAEAGWEKLLNRRSTTWRELDDAEKEGLDGGKAVELILRHPTLMKRPVFDRTAGVLVGFDEKVRQALA